MLLVFSVGSSSSNGVLQHHNLLWFSRKDIWFVYQSSLLYSHFLIFLLSLFLSFSSSFCYSILELSFVLIFVLLCLCFGSRAPLLSLPFILFWIFISFSSVFFLLFWCRFALLSVSSCWFVLFFVSSLLCSRFFFFSLCNLPKLVAQGKKLKFHEETRRKWSYMVKAGDRIESKGERTTAEVGPFEASGLLLVVFEPYWYHPCLLNLEPLDTVELLGPFEPLDSGQSWTRDSMVSLVTYSNTRPHITFLQADTCEDIIKQKICQWNINDKSGCSLGSGSVRSSLSTDSFYPNCFSSLSHILLLL